MHPSTRLRTSVSSAILLLAALGSASLVTAQGPAIKQAPRTDVHGELLPDKALARCGSTLFGHTGAPPAVAFSPDGKLLVMAPRESGRTVFLWDVARRRVVHHLGPSSVATVGVAFTPDNRLVAVVTENHAVFWDVTDGKKRAQEFRGNWDVAACALSPDGKYLALGGSLRRGKSRSAVVLWEVATGRELPPFSGHVTPVHALAFSTDGKRLVSCSVNLAAEDRTVRGKLLAWDTTSGKPLLQRELPSEAFAFLPVEASGAPPSHRATRLSTDGKLLALPAGDTLSVHHVESGRQLFRVESYWHNTAVFSPDGKSLVIGGGHEPLSLRDAATGNGRRSIAATAALKTVVPLAFSADGKRLVSSGGWVADTALHLWDVAAERELPLAPGHRAPVTCVAFAADGKTLATASDDGTARLWDRTGRELSRAAAGKGAVWGVAVRPEGPQVVTAEIAAAVTADGKDVLAVSRNGTISRRTATQGEWNTRLDGVVGEMACAALSADGTLLAGAFSQGESGGWGLWETGSGKRRWVRPRAAQRFGAFALSPDGHLLASSETTSILGRGPGLNPVIRVREAATGEEICTLKCPQGAPVALAFAANGRTLVSAHGLEGGGSEDLAIWDVAAGKQTGRLKGHHGPVNCVAFAPDGRTLASGSFDNTALLWDAARVPPATPTKAAPLTAQEQEALWTALAEGSAPAAGQAMWRLAQAPAQAFPLLRSRLGGGAQVDAKAIEQLIRDLDDKRFRVREQAQTALRKLGVAAGPALRVALKGNLPEEQRRRVERLLGYLEGAPPSAAELRALRGVALLEWIGDAEAGRTLAALARGATSGFVARQAEAALQRLARRSGAVR